MNNCDEKKLKTHLKKKHVSDENIMAASQPSLSLHALGLGLSVKPYPKA